MTHAHQDHIGGVKDVHQRFGKLDVLKKPWPTAGPDDAAGVPLTELADNDEVTIEGRNVCGQCLPPVMRPIIFVICWSRKRRYSPEM